MATSEDINLAIDKEHVSLVRQGAIQLRANVGKCLRLQEPRELGVECVPRLRESTGALRYQLDPRWVGPM
jgi:hypothetical protein